MRFLLDQNLPVALCVVISEMGHDAEHVASLGLSTASDADVFAAAVKSGAALVSKDGDFVALCSAGGAPLVRLRVGNCSNADLREVVRSIWPQAVAALSAGERIVEVRR